MPTTRTPQPDRAKPQARRITLQRATRAAADAAADPAEAPTVPGLDAAARTLTFPFSSEAPVERWFGDEILDHSPGCANLDRLNDGAPLLFNHNMDDVLGVVEKAWVDPADRRGYATVRFAKTPRADEVLAMVADGILRNVSFMYSDDEWVVEGGEGDPDDPDDITFRVVNWTTYEVSVVTVPADQTVGVGRSYGAEAADPDVSPNRRQPRHLPRDLSPPEPLNHEDTMNNRFRTHRLQNAVTEMGAAGGTGTVTPTPARTFGNAGPDPVAAERQRYTDIVALGRQHDLPGEKVDGMIQRGITIEAARGEVLEHIQQRQGGPVAALGGGFAAEMTPKEQRAYSFFRALKAAATGDWSQAGFEKEVAEGMRTKGLGNGLGNLVVPTDLPFAPTEEHARAYNMLMSARERQGRTINAPAQFRAAYQVGTALQGGTLVATNLLADQFIEVLRNRLVVSALGARFLTGLTGKVDLPRQISQTATNWVGESSASTEAEFTTDKVSLSPKTITARSIMSRLALLQMTPAIEMLAREDLMAVIALAWDLAALSGSGASNQPTGIVNQAGVNSVVGGTNGVTFTFDHLIQLKYATKVANAAQNTSAFALNSKTIGYLSTLKASTGQYLWEPQGGLTTASPDKVKGSNYAESQQLRSNLTKGSSSGICSEAIYAGAWSELILAEWGSIDILVNPFSSTEFANGDVQIRAFQSVDVGVRHAASFAVMSDGLTTGF